MKIFIDRNLDFDNVGFNKKTDLIVDDLTTFSDNLLKEYIKKLNNNENLILKFESFSNSFFDGFDDVDFKSKLYEKILKTCINLKLDNLIELLKFNEKYLFFENIFVSSIFIEKLGINFNELSDRNICIVTNKIYKHKYDYIYEGSNILIDDIIKTSFTLTNMSNNSIFEYIDTYYEIIEDSVIEYKWILNTSIDLSLKYEILWNYENPTRNIKLIFGSKNIFYWIFVGICINFDVNCNVNINDREEYNEVSKYFS